MTKHVYMHICKGGCGKPAFYYDHMPEAGEQVQSKCATLLKGTPPNFGHEIICGSCASPLGGLERKYLVPCEAEA